MINFDLNIQNAIRAGKKLNYGGELQSWLIFGILDLMCGITLGKTEIFWDCQ